MVVQILFLLKDFIHKRLDKFFVLEKLLKFVFCPRQKSDMYVFL